MKLPRRILFVLLSLVCKLLGMRLCEHGPFSISAGPEYNTFTLYEGPECPSCFEEAAY